ncbi:ATP-binding protein [Heliorestis acidaminivorans]|uniref:ATP-binding protein n=1 Tax=Heliorestis acidaminivorans TaxID=553427 RepID=A0A6I0EU07_9FIRM|nr:ATP-binding protein [Heliorestis acidaminivorans]KAB2954275.1 ATP-binding protein [Heliorestis acidaminivorans]
MSEEKFMLDFIADPNMLYISNNQQLKNDKPEGLLDRDITLYHIEEITFEDKAPRKEALENVMSSLQIEGINFVYIIQGNEFGVHFYFGIAKDLHADADCVMELPVYDLGRNVLLPSLKGNFRGSKISEVQPKVKSTIMETIKNMTYCCYLEGVPGTNEDNEKFQGVDRLVDVMLGEQFSVVIIAKPLAIDDISAIERNLYRFYTALVPLMKKNIQEGVVKATGTSSSVTKSKTDNIGENISTTKQTGTGTNTNWTEGTSFTETRGDNKGETKNIGKPSSSTTNSVSDSVNTGTSHSKANGTSKSESSGKSSSDSHSHTQGSSSGTSIGDSKTEGSNTSDSTSATTTLEFVNKEAQDWIAYLDEIIFKRLDYGKGKGIFVTSIVLLSQCRGSLIKLENTVKSLYSGESGNKVPLRKVPLSKQNYRSKAFRSLQIPRTKFQTHPSLNELSSRAACSQFIKQGYVHVGNWLSTNELSMIAGLPQKEIVGLGLREEVDFGLNFNTNIEDNNRIELGNLVQSGTVLNDIPVYLDKENMNKHTFVTGVTGSGKTTTCQKMLIYSGLPFLVIEPAKTEYRILNRTYDDLLVFTLGVDTVAPFRLNPFEFFPHESITSRVDMIKASIEAAFDMEAAIPQIIESAIYECYQDCGWNISQNRNTKYQNPFADGVYAFPTLTDLMNKTEKVVEKQGFDERLKRDYIGSIRARLQGLTIGAKGLMLDTKRSIDFADLLERKVVLELEEIRSGSEKALILGFILTNLIEAMKVKSKINSDFKHITLFEEAHRLLSKYEPGDSLNKKQSVETFTDMLAEVRKYGESLIIVDQIPGKLTPEVLKNTNTKVVHKIFAQDDKEAIGNTMVLTDEQKKFLSNLDVGRAIVFTQGWPKALQVQVNKTTNTTGEEYVKDEELRKNVMEYYRKMYKRGIFLGLECLQHEPDLEQFLKYIEYSTDSSLVDNFRNYYKEPEAQQAFTARLKQITGEEEKEFVLQLLLHGGSYPIGSWEKSKTILNEFINDVLNRSDKMEEKKLYYYNHLKIKL